MLLFDLAVPRDIESGVAELDDAYLYTVDDLERAVEDNRRSRREAADAAEAIIELQVARYIENLHASIAPGTAQAPARAWRRRARRRAGQGAPATGQRPRCRRKCSISWPTP